MRPRGEAKERSGSRSRSVWCEQDYGDGEEEGKGRGKDEAESRVMTSRCAG